jgi:hypothetical protein
VPVTGAADWHSSTTLVPKNPLIKENTVRFETPPVTGHQSRGSATNTKRSDRSDAPARQTLTGRRFTYAVSDAGAGTA